MENPDSVILITGKEMKQDKNWYNLCKMFNRCTICKKCVKRI